MHTQPFLGFDSYTSSNSEIFGGRDAECIDLTNKVLNWPYTFCYGKTGVGKTSLFKAGLRSYLENESCIFLYLRINFNAERSPLNQLVEHIKSYFRQEHLGVDESKDLNELLSYVRSRNPGTKKFVLVLDQFEEYFVFEKSSSHQDRDAFIRKLSFTLHHPVDFIKTTDGREESNSLQWFHIIFSLREDYWFVTNEKLKSTFPKRNDYVFTLHNMSFGQAIKAIDKPANKFNLIIDQDAIEFIITQVSESGNDQGALDKLDNGLNYDMECKINPLLLNFYCFKLAEPLLENEEFRIDKAHVDRLHFDGLFRIHFETAYSQISPELQEAIENLALDDGIHRNKINQLALIYNVDKYEIELKILQDAKIIKIEGPSDRREVELIHDRLVPIVYEKKQTRRERKREQAISDEIMENRKKRRVKYLITALTAASFTLLTLVNAYYQVKKEKESKSLISEARIHSGENPILSLNLANYANELVSDPSNQRDQLRIYYENRFYNTLIKKSSIIYGSHFYHDDKILSIETKDTLSLTDLNGNLVWRHSITKYLKSLIVSSDQTQFAIGTLDGYVYLGNPETGKLSTPIVMDPSWIVTSHDNDSSWITDLAITPDNRYLFAVGKNRSVPVSIDLTTKKTNKFEKRNGHDGDVWAVEYDPVHQWVFTAASDGYVKKWSSSGQFIENFYHLPLGNDTYIYDLKLSKGGKTLLVPSGLGKIYLVDTMCYGDSLSLQGEIKDKLFSVNFSPDENYILSGDENGVTRLWHRSGDLLQELRGEANLDVLEVAMTPHNDFVITAGKDQSIKKWSTSGLMLNRTGIPTPLLDACFWFDNGKLIEVKLPDKKKRFKALFTADGNPLELSTDFKDPYIVRQNSKYLAVIDGDPESGFSNLYVFNKQTHQWKNLGEMKTEANTYTKPGNGAYALHPEKPILTYFSYEDGEGVNWDLSTNVITSGFQEYPDVNDDQYVTTYSPSGRYLVYGAEGAFAFYDCQSGVPTRKERKECHTKTKQVSCFSFDEKNDFMASGSFDGSICIWQISNLKLLKAIFPPAGAGQVTRLVFSPDGNHILVGFDSGLSYLFKVSNGLAVQKIGVLNQEGCYVLNAGFSPNGKSVVIQYSSGYTRLFEIRESLESFLQRGDYDKMSKEDLNTYLKERNLD